jgi:hypothetical protein
MVGEGENLDLILAHMQYYKLKSKGKTDEEIMAIAERYERMLERKQKRADRLGMIISLSLAMVLIPLTFYYTKKSLDSTRYPYIEQHNSLIYNTEKEKFYWHYEDKKDSLTGLVNKVLAPPKYDIPKNDSWYNYPPEGN